MRLTQLYGLVLVLGGLIGYIKAGSLPSLLAGIFGGLFFLLVQKRGLLLPCLALFTLFFVWRWTLSGNFMPSGLMTLLTAALFATRFSRPLYR